MLDGLLFVHLGENDLIFLFVGKNRPSISFTFSRHSQADAQSGRTGQNVSPPILLETGLFEPNSSMVDL